MFKIETEIRTEIIINEELKTEVLLFHLSIITDLFKNRFRDYIKLLCYVMWVVLNDNYYNFKDLFLNGVLLRFETSI